MLTPVPCTLAAMETRLLPPTDDGLRIAGGILRDGGLVGFPTETVYGLGGNALDADATSRIFAAKGRPADNPLIVHVPDADHLGGLAEPTPLALRLAEAFWPGPLTIVLDARPHVPRTTTAGLDTVAVRVPDHPVAIGLLDHAGVPVAAPSANRSGRPSPTAAHHVMADLGGSIDAVIDGGQCVIGVESTVVDARGDHPIVLREGAVTREDLGVERQGAPGDTAASPGTRHVHYRPTSRVVIAPEGQAAEVATKASALESVGLVARGPVPEGVSSLGRFDRPGELAALLYGAMRDAEAAGLDVLVVEAVPEVGVGRAVMDRLRRAAGST